MATFGAMYFSVLGVGPCRISQKCWSVSGLGEIIMIFRRVPSYIELLGAPLFDLWAGGEEAVIVSMAGDGVGGFMDDLGIQFLKRSRSLEMVVSCL